MSGSRRGAPIGGRGKTTRVKSARGRPVASTRWLERQLNDPYVAAAKRLGYPSRAAFKLIEIDDRFHLLRPGLRVVDLGAAPGGWTRVAAERVRAGVGTGLVVAIDVTPFTAPAGVIALAGDVLDGDAPSRLEDALGGGADVVLSDMAAPTTGHAATDHLRIMALAEAAFAFAAGVLRPGGAFLCKVLQGGTEGALLAEIKRRFRTVRHVKPPSSRADSAEMYVLAMGFRAAPEG